MGNVTVDYVDADRTSMRETTKRLWDLRRRFVEECDELDGLLGLAMGTHLQLVTDSATDFPDTSGIRAGLQGRILSRPDIRALAAGYASQEASFRGAILEQFPSLGLGFNRARDVGGTNTVGFGIDLDLPLFNGNRGNIAIAKATRRQLFTEYSNRIARSRDEAETSMAILSLLNDQGSQARVLVAHLDSLAEFAGRAYALGELARDGFVRYRVAALEGRIARIELDESRREQGIALKTLLGPDPDAKQGKGISP
jgi:outer membrane protein TolC